MKLLFELEPAQREALEGAGASLEKIIARHAARVKQIAGFRATEAKVIAIIAKLREKAGDGTDLKAAEALAAREFQIGLLRNTIQRTGEEIGPRFLEQVQAAVRYAHRTIHEATKGQAEVHADQIAEKLEPFCESPTQALLIVKQTVPSFQYVLVQTREHFGRAMPDLATALGIAAEQLPVIEALLNGGDYIPDYAPPRRANRAASRAQLAPESLGTQPQPITPEDRKGHVVSVG